jgi:hypothetical protein
MAPAADDICTMRPAPRSSMRQHVARQHQWLLAVEPGERPEIGVVGRRRTRARFNTGVVDQDIDVPERVETARSERVDVIGGAQISDDVVTNDAIGNIAQLRLRGSPEQSRRRAADADWRASTAPHRDCARR